MPLRQPLFPFVDRWLCAPRLPEVYPFGDKLFNRMLYLYCLSDDLAETLAKILQKHPFKTGMVYRQGPLVTIGLTT